MELTFWSYLDLAVQLAILAALLADVLFVKKKGDKLHAWLMTIALTVNSAFILALMIPQFIPEVPEISENIFNPESLLFLGHGIVGFFAEAFALFIVIRWLLNGFKVSACRGKNLMKTTMIIWVASVLLGIVIFAIHLIETL